MADQNFIRLKHEQYLGAKEGEGVHIERGRSTSLVLSNTKEKSDNS